MRPARVAVPAVALALAVALAVGACDAVSEATASPSASTDVVVNQPPVAVEAQILGPWQATPFRLPAQTIARVDAACRASMPEFPVNVQLVILDARGEGMVQLYYANGIGDSAECNDVAIRRNGEIVPQGGGGVGHGLPLRPLRPDELEIFSQTGNGRPIVASQLAGRVGASIVRVMLRTKDGKLAQASLDRGWFAVWFPGDVSGGFVAGYDVFGNEIARFTF
jgi:hypothetical protein